VNLINEPDAAHATNAEAGKLYIENIEKFKKVC
jgi:hypothetical protein